MGALKWVFPIRGSVQDRPTLTFTKHALMPDLRSGGDLTVYLEAGEISGEDALDLLRRAGILKPPTKQVPAQVA